MEKPDCSAISMTLALRTPVTRVRSVTRAPSMDRSRARARLGTKGWTAPRISTNASRDPLASTTVSA
ncbi:hypothetical protein ANTQUA_LOCUS7038 [Anthophora quadrimaculata]